MILVDTAVWIDHFRDGDSQLIELLDRGVVLAHPWVTGELALVHLRGRAEILRLLDDLPQASVASAAELLHSSSTMSSTASASATSMRNCSPPRC